MEAGFWSGAGGEIAGAVIGALTSLVIALLVLRVTQRHDRRIVREGEVVRFAMEVHAELFEVVEASNRFLNVLPDWGEVAAFRSRCRAMAQRLLTLESFGHEDYDYAVSDLIEFLSERYPAALRDSEERRDNEALTRIMSDIGTHCLNVAEFIASVIRPRRVGRRPWYRRWKIDREQGLPWFRRRNLVDDLSEIEPDPHAQKYPYRY